MWVDALQVSTQRVTDALLRKHILPGNCTPFEKVSGALAVRHALTARERDQTLIFEVPQVTAKTARHITAALLVGNHAHASGGSELPTSEVRPLIKGDVLLVTAAISNCTDELELLPIGSYNHLTDYWEVIPFSRYTSSKAEKPRVFVANPGWMLKGTAGRRFGAVIIDASHPRTHEQLNILVRSAQGCSDIRIAVTPPLDTNEKKAIGYPAKAAIWVWDPFAMADAEMTVTGTPVPVSLPDRTLWVCDSDTEASKTLAHLHQTLVTATKAAVGQFYPGLTTCWSVYNRLKQLVVSLVDLEQRASHGWARSLKNRVESLDEVNGFGAVGWETTWSELREAVNSAYKVMLKREETAKFWALASNIERFLSSKESRLRIVLPTELECEMAVSKIGYLLNNFNHALTQGHIDLVTPSQEARLIAEGVVAPTHLLGPRTNGYRYLDVFPQVAIDQYLYPHELAAVRAQQGHLYDAVESFMGDEQREVVLKPFDLQTPRTSPASKPLTRPQLIVTGASLHDIKVATDASVSATLDVDEILDTSPIGPRSVLQPNGSSSSAPAGGVIEVLYKRGETTQFYESHSVDVVFSETGEVHRYPVTELQPGWFIISFVDDRYDNLFRRLTEVVNSRLDSSQRMALELWQTVKSGLMDKYQNRKALYEQLVERGLTTAYETFTTWLREGPEGVLAPQQLDEFRLLASESDVFKSEALLNLTFDAIRHARGRNRAAGRKLKQFLRAVVTGDGYDQALESARKVDAALGDVLAAVEVLEIAAIHRIQRR